MWIKRLKEHDDKKGIKWVWQSLDSISTKSPLVEAMTDTNPTNRSRQGTKKHILTDKNGLSLSVSTTSASTHDIKAVAELLITQQLSSDHILLVIMMQNMIDTGNYDNTLAGTKHIILNPYNRR